MLIQVGLIVAAAAGQAFPRLLDFCDGLCKCIRCEVRCAVENVLDIMPLDLALVQEESCGGAIIPSGSAVWHHTQHFQWRVAGPGVNPLPVGQLAFLALFNTVQAAENGKGRRGIFPTFRATLYNVRLPGAVTAFPW